MSPAGPFVPGPVALRVPATSANLGPGFDALGLALDLDDLVEAEVVPDDADGPDGLVVEVDGEGADDPGLPRDASHLVVRAMVAGFETLGVAAPGRLRLSCRNAVPHSRGLGSSAAAIVAGLGLARALVRGGEQWTDAELLQLAAEIEGHPDNVAPAVLGGFTVAVAGDGGADGVPRYAAARLEVHPDVRFRALVPPTPVSTAVARGLLPEAVPHVDAARNAGRAALLVAALTTRPDLLLEATEDRLHQAYRAPAMPDTDHVVRVLREHGLAAVVSGAGPTVLVLDGVPEGAARRPLPPGVVPASWRVLDLGVAEGAGRL